MPLYQLLIYAICGHLRYVVSAAWNIYFRYRETWSPLLCGTYASAGCLFQTFVAPVSRLRYGTFVASVCRLRYGIFVASVGPLRYVEPLSLQLVAQLRGTFVASVGCCLRYVASVRCSHYVYLFQTGPALGHVPALLPDRSSLRARTCIASRQV